MENLYRATEVDTMKEVKGFYVNACRPNSKQKDHTYHFIISYPGRYPEDWHEIYTGTLSRFTGMQDKHGVDVYENDMVRYCNDSEERGEEKYRTGKVFWQQHRASWAVCAFGEDTRANNDLYRYLRNPNRVEVIRKEEII